MVANCIQREIPEAAAYHAQVPLELLIISPESLGTHAGGTASGEIPFDENFNLDGGLIHRVPPSLFGRHYLSVSFTRSKINVLILSCN